MERVVSPRSLSNTFVFSGTDIKPGSFKRYHNLHTPWNSSNSMLDVWILSKLIVITFILLYYSIN